MILRDEKHGVLLGFFHFFMTSTLLGSCIWFMRYVLISVFDLYNFPIALILTAVWFLFTYALLLLSFSIFSDRELDKYTHYRDPTIWDDTAFYIYLFVNFAFMWPYHLLRVMFNFKDINWSIIRIAIERL
jgi:hypothetical protein